MKFHKLKLNQSGFSLAEIMVAAGLISVVAMVMTQMSSTGLKLKQSTDRTFELSALYTEINSILKNDLSCQETLSNLATNANIPAVVKVSSTGSSSNSNFVTNANFDNGKIRLTRMHLSDYEALGGGTRQGKVTLNFTFDRVVNGVPQNRPTIMRMTKVVSLNTSNRITDCQPVSSFSCEVLGGTMSGGKCNNVNIAGEVRSNTEICVGSKCRRFDEHQCPSGMYADGIEEDGRAKCTPYPSSNHCNAGFYADEIGTDGIVKCAPLPNYTVACPTNKYLRGINLATRQATCVDVPVAEKGDKGDTGPQGPTGPKGDKGDIGATGATGPTGAQGPQGDQGSKGALGPAGPRGSPGATGPTGPSGATGPRGYTGPPGPPGPPGPAGTSGGGGDGYTDGDDSGR